MIRILHELTNQVIFPLAHPRTLFPVAVVKVASIIINRDYMVPALTAGFFIPASLSVVTGHMQFGFIGIAMGLELIPHLIRETNVMIQQGCNITLTFKPGKLLENYMFCKQRTKNNLIESYSIDFAKNEG